MSEFKVVYESNEWLNWIEEAIANNYFKYYDYKHFRNIEEIGTGSFGKVYRANWKNSYKHLALKSFFNFNDATIKEVVHELKLQRDIYFHDNVVRIYGITYSDQENQNDQLKKCSLVMEYADGGTFQNYLKECFDELTWNDKFNLALQSAYAVSSLHDEGIVHCNLHPGNVLVHQNEIKLADFGLSKRIEVASNSRSKLCGIIPYIDPKRFNRRRNKNNQTQINDKKSDVYSVGMILWEISSGIPPFYTEGESHDVELAVEISLGLKETIVPNTPDDYANLYTECWDNEPDNRPTMNQVVERLRSMISALNNDQTADLQLPNEQQFISINNETSSSRNFDKLNTIGLIEPSGNDENNLLGIVDEIVDEIVDIIFKVINEGKASEQSVLDYFNNHKIDLQEIYNCLLNNQNNSNSIFVLGYLNYYGIGINENNERAFNLFIDALEHNHILAEYFVGVCHQFGYGTVKNEKLAFECNNKTANKGFIEGEFQMGLFYYEGIGIEKDAKLAVYWYKKAASKGHLIAMNNLASLYKNGEGVERDNNIALALYQEAANLGQKLAQYNLALLYESGIEILQDINQAIYWYEKAAEQGDQDAQDKLKELSTIENTI